MLEDVKNLFYNLEKFKDLFSNISNELKIRFLKDLLRKQI